MRWTETVCAVVPAFVIAMGAVAVFAVVGAMLGADGRVDFCYPQSAIAVTEKTNPAGAPVMLRGHRSMTLDVTLGYYATQEDAVAAARKMGCPLAWEKP